MSDLNGKSLSAFSAKHGTTTATSTRFPWLYLLLDGEEGGGKTHTAFSAPGPILYLCLEPGGEVGVIEKFANEKHIEKKYFILSDPEEKARNDPKKQALIDEATQKRNIKVWDDFKEMFEDGLRSELFRTLIVDPITQARKLSSLARFGKNSQIPALQKELLNSEWSYLLDLPKIVNANPTRKLFTNVILLGRMKDEWKNTTDAQTGKEKGYATGKKIPQAREEVRYAVHTIARAYRQPKGKRIFESDVEALDNALGFRIQILHKSKGANVDVDMTELRGDEANFLGLACTVAPEVDMMAWME